MITRQQSRHRARDAGAAATAEFAPEDKRRRVGSLARAPPSAAQGCDADSLGIIFSFLELPELAMAARTSTRWLHVAAERTASLRWLVEIPPSSWPELARSRLRRHIGGLRYSRWGNGLSGRVDPLPFNLLSSLLPALPVLVQLELFLMHENPQEALLPLPHTLRVLHLSFVREPTAATAQMLATAVSACTQLLELQLHISPDSMGSWTPKPRVSDAFLQRMIDVCGTCTSLQIVDFSFPRPEDDAIRTDIDLAPLLQCAAALQRLHMSGLRLKSAHMLVIKQLSQLHWVDVGRLSPELLAELCTPPHQLQQLEILNCGDAKFDVAEMQHVLKIPSLTRLHVGHYTDAALALLPRLPLREVSFSGGVFNADFDSPECLYATLQQCHAVQCLRLSYVTLTRQQGVAILTAMSQLKRVTLWNCPMPDGLVFLHRAPPSLTSLELERCYSLNPRHLLRDLKPVPQLQELIVNECFFGKLSKAQIRQLTPPSKLLPNLKHFDYIPYEG